jgi:predicted phage-related endonuclease
LVPVRKFHTRIFKRTLNYLQRCAPWPACSGLQLVNSDESNTRLIGKPLLAPSKKATRCPALLWRKHRGSLPNPRDSHNSIKNVLTFQSINIIHIHIINMENHMAQISNARVLARRDFVGGSDARIIMGRDEEALLRLWREKRGEAGPEDLSRNLVVQLGKATEQLNREWFQTATGQQVIDIQKHMRHPGVHWMGATLDGRVEASGAVFESKFMLPWSFSEETAAEKYAPQLQHNMFVVAARVAVLSIITGGGKWVEIKTHADPLYQHLIVTAERKFWRCVETGEPPALLGVDPPKPRIEAVRIVDMTSSNAWAEFAAIFVRTREAHQEHERAKTELKSLVPEDAQQAMGHGIRAKRSKSGAVSFDLLTAEGDYAAGK